MCALNVANWSDRQLDELSDLIKTADHSNVAAFITSNFLAMEPNPSAFADAGSSVPLNTSTGRIMADNSATDAQPLRVLVSDITTMVTINPGVFIYGGKVGQIDSLVTVNVTDPTTSGTYGTGKAAEAQPRYSIVEIRATDLPSTAQLRWFVDDSTDPNTYSQKSTYTLLNKAYPDIKVKHGVAGATPTPPAADTGYWCIAEILIPASTNAILQSTIYDTVNTASRATTANWTDPTAPPVSQTRIGRLEFGNSLFGIDHYTAGQSYPGHHRKGVWQIDGTVVTVSAGQINWLDGTGVAYPGHAQIIYSNFQKLFDGSNCDSLHIHGGGGGTTYPFYVDHAASGHHNPIFTWGATAAKETDWQTLISGPLSDASSLHMHGGGSGSQSDSVFLQNVQTQNHYPWLAIGSYADIAGLALINFNAIPNSKYIIQVELSLSAWVGNLGDYTKINLVKFRLTDNTNVMANSEWLDTIYPVTTITQFVLSSFHHFATLVGGSHTIQVQGLSEDIINVGVNRGRITIFKVG